MPTVLFAGQTVECPEGANLRMVLIRARLPLYTRVARAIHCRGHGACGTCAVQIEGPVSEPTAMEKRRLRLPPHDLAAGLRLACQCNVLGDIVVTKHKGLWGQDTDSASQFTSTAYDITSRTRTTAAVAWSPPAWGSIGAAGVDQRTADISSIIQEILDRPGWSSGNALVNIITGTGTRTAESYDGDAGAAPLLHVEWDVGGGGSISHVPGSWRREVEAP